jgi:hypothetical protein
MSALPIIMSTPMVRAILREIEAPGTGKTMTRRLALKPVRAGNAARPSEWLKVKLGDRLWVRENIWQTSRYPFTMPSGEPSPQSMNWGSRVQYAADGKPENTPNRHYPNGLQGGAISAPDPDSVWMLRPSIHMPRARSRLTLDVTAVKVEQLQDISEEDALAEGCKCSGWHKHPQLGIVTDDGELPSEEYQRLWNTLHGDEAWDANPEIVVITFKPVLQNIDKVAS